MVGFADSLNAYKLYHSSVLCSCIMCIGNSDIKTRAPHWCQCSAAVAFRNLYHISSFIRQSFFRPKQCKMAVDFWDCLGRAKLVL